MAQIGIVIVTYSSGAEIGRCLEAAQASGADIIVVDNASPDGTADEVNRRGVRLIANQKNLGFAAAVNQGIRALNCPYILLLNPDAVIEGGVEDLRAACERRHRTAGNSPDAVVTAVGDEYIPVRRHGDSQRRIELRAARRAIGISGEAGGPGKR